MQDWLRQVFDHPDAAGIWTIVWKTVVVYLFLVVGLRLLGKRELGQMNIYDLVMIVVLGNAVQNAMINNDTTLAGGLVSASTLLILNRAFNELIRRSKKIEIAMVGDPTLIVANGKVIESQMRHEGVTSDQLMAALREHGLDSLKDVDSCVLEVDGTISVVPISSKVFKTKRHYRALRLP